MGGRRGLKREKPPRTLPYTPKIIIIINMKMRGLERKGNGSDTGIDRRLDMAYTQTHG